MSEVIRWGMIGCGDVAERKSGPAFSRIEGSVLAAVMSRNGARAQDYARRHGVARWHDDAQDIIGASDLDAVYIATPTSSHHELTLRCAAAGKPVYVEKPMAMNSAEAAQMVEACRDAQVPLWVAYYRRALPRILEVDRLLRSGAIGDVLMVRSERFEPLPAPETMDWRFDPSVSGGGLFFEAVCHTLDALDLLFGPIEELHGAAANQMGAYPAEDGVVASYRFASGVLGSGAWCFASDTKRQGEEVLGTRGRLAFSLADPEPILLERDGERHTIAVEDPEHVQEPLITTIVEELHGRGICPSPGSVAMRTTRVTEQILRSFVAPSR